MTRLFKYLFLFFFLTQGMNAHAEPAKQMVIAGLEAPPYTILDKEGKASGIVVELIRQALKPLDIEPVFKITNWARAYRTTLNAHADALIPTIKSTDRERYFIFPEEPLNVLHMALLAHPDTKITYTGKLEELIPYRIGKVREARVTPAFDQAFTSGKLRVEERTSFSLLALAVANKRLDLMAGDELMSVWSAAENGVLDQVNVIQPYLDHVPTYLAISKFSPYAGEAEAISKALKDAKKNKDFQASLRAYEKYLQRDIFERLIQQVDPALPPK